MSEKQLKKTDELTPALVSFEEAYTMDPNWDKGLKPAQRVSGRVKYRPSTVLKLPDGFSINNDGRGNTMLILPNGGELEIPHGADFEHGNDFQWIRSAVTLDPSRSKPGFPRDTLAEGDNNVNTLVVFDEEDRPYIAMLVQWRPHAGEFFAITPMGFRGLPDPRKDARESHKAGSRREVAEETGFTGKFTIVDRTVTVSLPSCTSSGHNRFDYEIAVGHINVEEPDESDEFIMQVLLVSVPRFLDGYADGVVEIDGRQVVFGDDSSSGAWLQMLARRKHEVLRWAFEDYPDTLEIKA